MKNFQLSGLSREQLKDGYATPVGVGNDKVLLVRLGHELRAISAWCTHMRTELGEQPVAADGLIECPLHGAVFDTEDGSLQLGPTCGALPTYDVEVDDSGAISVAPSSDSPAPQREARASSFGSWGRAYK